VADFIYAGDAGAFKTFNCAECSKLSRRNSNSQKYCEDCARAVNLRSIADGKRQRRLAERENRQPHLVSCIDCCLVFEAARAYALRCERCGESHKKNSAKKRQAAYRSVPGVVEKQREAAKSDGRKAKRSAADKRRRSTPRSKFESAVKLGIRRGLQGGSKAGRKTFDLLGYTVDDLRAHLEKQFTGGMSWDNYGDWHIDHIIPLSAHNYSSPDHEDFKRAWALSNLQPLWAMDNIKKNARLSAPFQPSLAL
jgi:hypothetical protein